LVTWAAGQFELCQVTGKDGLGHPITLRDELSGIPKDKRGADVNALLDGPEMPTAGAHLWEWFCELSNVRRGGLSGPEPIGLDQLDAWQRLHGVKLHSWEIGCIEALDMKWREISNRYAEQRNAN
jgi:hypothetical protein